MNNVGPIKEETRKKVLQSASELGYVPNANARRLALRKSGNVGVILPFVPKVHLFSTYYFSEILSGIGETANRCGYDLLLIFRQPDEERDYARLFRTQKIDACIVLGSREEPGEREALDELKREGFPFCLVNQRFDGAGFMTVDADHAAGSAMAVTHLLERGRRSIAFVNGPSSFSNSRDRYEGYEKTMADAGIAVRREWLFEGNYSRKSGYSLAPAVAAAIRGGEADAVFAANDRMAIGLMQGLKEQGLEAGADYVIAGYDDSDASRLISPQLTTVAVPFYEMGKLAAERLLDRDGASRGGADPELEWLLPVTLVCRSST